MKVKAAVIGALFALGGTIGGSAAWAGTVYVNLGASAQDFTLYGQGFSGYYSTDGNDTPLGTFTDSQGAGVYNPITNTSTFTLSGNIAGGSTGFSSGTYSFTTSYAGLDTPQGGPSALGEVSIPSNPAYFEYDSIDPSTDITLTLNTGGRTYVEPLFADDNFVSGTNFSFAFTTASCTGVSVCTQNNVGLMPGATISGPTTINASFTVPSAVPEPSTWLLMLAGIGSIGLMLRQAKKVSGVRFKDCFTA